LSENESEGSVNDGRSAGDAGEDIDAVSVDSLKALDPNRPIREADMGRLAIVAALSAQSGDYCCATAVSCSLIQATSNSQITANMMGPRKSPVTP
jgi:hypothetical protein